MKMARNLIGILLLAAVGYACEPEELPIDKQTTVQGNGDQGDVIIGSDGKPIKR